VTNIHHFHALAITPGTGSALATPIYSAWRPRCAMIMDQKIIDGAGIWKKRSGRNF